jgi:hypothetical protein
MSSASPLTPRSDEISASTTFRKEISRDESPLGIRVSTARRAKKQAEGMYKVDELEGAGEIAGIEVDEEVSGDEVVEGVEIEGEDDEDEYVEGDEQ